MNENDRVQALLEDVNGKFDAIMEYVRDIPAMKADIAELKDDMSHVKSDIEVIKGVAKEHSRDIAELKAR